MPLCYRELWTVRVRLSKLLFLAIPLAAQTLAPIGIAHGSLVECGSGELRIRTAANQLLSFGFDSKTYFERAQERTTPAHLEKNDWLEIVSDQWPGGSMRYARTVHVIDQSALARSPHRPLRAYSSPADPVLPRPEQTFSGVVERMSGGRLLLRTRAGSVETFLLRQDTRYLAAGNLVDASALQPYTRVFVRAGKNVDNQTEAYQVVWGDILQPR